MNTNILKSTARAVKRIVCCNFAIFCIITISLFSCDQMDATYKEFIKNGETIYPGKADSVKTYSGNYRIKLSWLLLADPSITKAKIYWNNKKDSLVVPIQRTKGIDTIGVIINNLDERIYTFTIYTYDSDGYKSVSSEISGTAYGDIYRSSIVNRGIDKLAVVNGELVINWKTAAQQSVGDELVYTDNSGTSQSIIVLPGDKITTLKNYMIGTNFKYRSLFLPNLMAIDTFFTEYQQVKAPNPPSAPVGLTPSAITETSFTLTWTASMDNVGIVGYDIYQGSVLKGSTSSNSYSMTGLSCNTTYAMTVKAKDASGNISASSSTLNVTTSNCGSEIIKDNTDLTGISFIGNWPSSAFNAGYYGTNYQHDGNTGATEGKSAKFTPTISTAGSYNVYIHCITGTAWATNAPVDVADSAGKIHTLSVNLKNDREIWVLLGTFDFTVGTSGYVKIRNDGANGNVIADAVKWIFVPGS